MAHSSLIRLAYVLCTLLSFCNLATLAVGKRNYHLTYYIYEVQGGPNATLLAAAGTGQGNLSAIGFGSFLVFDDVVRSGPSANTSDVVGTYRGTAVATSLEPIFPSGGLYLTAEVAFRDGSPYNGSRITVMGTVATAAEPYELIVPGGLGLFLGCTGYASGVPLSSPAPLFVAKYDVFLNCL